MNTLTRDQEQTIIKAAEDVVDLVNTGLHPNDALFKVASEESLTPDYVRRLTEVFNTSRILAHFKTAAPEKRADEFPLASASNVLNRLYPEKVETEEVKAARANCHSTWFSPPLDFTHVPRLEKVALTTIELTTTCAPPDLDLLVKRSRLHVDSLERSIDVAANDDAYYREMLRRAVVKAAAHFCSLEHRPFDVVENNVLTKHGSVAKPLMNAIFIACRGEQCGEKRGEAFAGQRLTESETEPYVSIEEALRHASEWCKSASETQALRDELSTFKFGFDARMKKLAELRRPRIPFPFEGIKLAVGWLPAVASTTFIGSKLNEMLGDDDSSLKFEQEVQQSIDPEQNAQIRGAKVKAMLNELMTSDPVISGYDPQQVLLAYNEISQMTPRVAEQPAILRGMLARRLEMGRTEPFEAEQAITAETGLQRVENPSRM